MTAEMTLSTIIPTSAFPGELSVADATVTWLVDGERTPEAGALESGCVCCIFTVAFGSAGPPLFGASLGRVMRAVSFFGETGFAMMPEGCAAAAGGVGIIPLGGAGRSGTVGLPVSGGGFGGGTALLSGRVGGAPMDLGGGGGTMPDAGGRVIFEVSFFGIELSGWLWAPGTLMRTVSRFTAGRSPFGGSVMRMVSFFVESSSWGVFDEGCSSAINV